MFMSYCLNGLCDKAFYRFIKGDAPTSLPEEKARTECGFRCKKELSEDKAIELFRKTLIKWINRERSGEIEPKQALEALQYNPKPHKSIIDENAKGKILNSLQQRCLDIRRNGK